ncbi:hypothetical protein CFR80_14805 [Komagataeibacter oboediens]|uniref:DUF945 domain-containing protein n=2 Tax=Acetobacteraceae TaxID=433 RepID=A0A318R265_9PROT|nr:hypothetical protein CFR80_14805 [Komagataeibacter oboediens]
MKAAPSVFAHDKHESRSERYTYIPTIDVVNGLRAEGFMPVHVSQGRSRIPGKANFTKHLIRFRRQGQGPTYTHLGELFPELILMNSHDGTSAYKIMAGMMRLRCFNGMIVLDKNLEEVRVPHKGNVTEKVIEGSYRVMDASQEALRVADHWSGVSLSRDEQMVLAEATHMLRFDEDNTTGQAIQPKQFLAPWRKEDRGDDLWHVANRLQENTMKGGLHGFRWDEKARRHRRVTTREVKSVETDVKVNRAIWHLSQRMAELKGAA